MRQLGLIVAVVVAVSGSAHADDKANLAAARKLLDTALKGGLEDSGSRPTTDDAITVFPAKLDKGGDWMSWRMGPPYVGAITIVASSAGWSGTWGWIAADISVTQRPYSDSSGAPAVARTQTHRYHVLEVYVLDGKEVKVKATMVVDTIADDKLPEVTHVPGGPPKLGSLTSYLTSPARAKLVANDNVAVMGSSQTEIGLGKAAMTKLLGTWGKLDLSITGTPKELLAGDLGIAVSEVDLLYKGKSRRLRAMVVAKKTNSEWAIAALSFGADSDFGDPKRY